MIESLTVKVDPQPAREYLTAVRNQVPFALALAINRTALEAQDEEKTGVRQRFIIRTPWTPEQIKFERGNWATKDKPVAILSVDKRAGFLVRFEDGGVQVMKPGRAGITLPFAVPTKALRSTPEVLIEKGMFPKALGFLPRVMPNPNGGGDAVVMAGRGKHSRRKGVRSRYFQMKLSGGQVDDRGGGVWARYGSGKGLPRGEDKIVFLWKFRSQIRIPASLKFTETVNGVIAKQFNANFDGFMEFAIRTAK